MNSCTKITLLFSTYLLFFSIQITAQDTNSQAYWIHEDRVMPSMVLSYEKSAKELVSNLEKYNIQDEKWITSSTNDFRYLYVTAIDKMADLDRPFFANLSEKMGSDALANLLKEMDKCYNRHFNYIIHLDKELSYMPNGITQTPEGKNYRKFHYLYFTPSKAYIVKDYLKAVKELYASKDSKLHYRVYKSGFGTQDDFYLIAVAAKNAVEYEQIGSENNELLGDAGNKIFDELFKNLKKYEEIPGRIREELGYSPKKVTRKN